MSQSMPDMLLRHAKKSVSVTQPEVRASRTRRESVVALSAVPLFTGLSKRHLQRLAKGTDELTFGAGDRIVEEGQLGETLFVVMEGRGKVTRRGRKVGDVVPGDFFGELSTIDGGPRSATITAETPMRVLRLYRNTLRALIEDEPAVAIKMLDGMARRIRQVERRSG